ncbi:MAG: hypothetical protein A2W85_05085 [Bacteroidetes bacterium GWF2_41_31]|nr:MAG: hypothetical protein A2W85_05085 [Bacteroidetes bacterium GWF2_41_31]OFZ07620.1 MAG: hypothetical protein A2338_08030 [Bacteroidetes bacterium RIFOXYB12_FULL_41_6]
MSSDRFPLFLLAPGVPNLSGWKKPERLNTAPEKLNLVKAKNLNFGLRYPVFRHKKVPNLSG